MSLELYNHITKCKVKKPRFITKCKVKEPVIYHELHG